MTTYAWNPKAHTGQFKKVDPEIVGRQIEQISEEYGVCAPRMLVEKARPKRSPIHGLFEWNDALAAEKWRIEQARAVVQTIRVVNPDGVIQDTPAFVHVKIVSEDGISEGYKPTIQLATDPAMRGFVLAEAITQLYALKRRYDGLKELEHVWAAVEQVKVKHKRKKQPA